MINGQTWINAADCGASGSEQTASGSITAGCRKLVLNETADFKTGDWVCVDGCHLHYYGTVYNDKAPALAKNQKQLTDEIEIRGLTEGLCHRAFVLHFENTNPVTFNWMAIEAKYQTLDYPESTILRKWVWQGEHQPISENWIPLLDGVEIRFRRTNWKPGELISFHAENRIFTRIVNMQGSTCELEHPANCSNGSALLKHHDQIPLQKAVDQALAERKVLLIPAGRFRLNQGLWLRNVPSFRMEGVDRINSILDVSEAHTAAIWIAGGHEITVRNLAMTGHTGFKELPSNTVFYTATGYAFWPTANQQMEVMGCAAVNAVSTESLLFEDLEVTRMSSEAFYLHGSDRSGAPPYIQAPHEEFTTLSSQYTRQCIYHRCHVSDCGFNAFNNNDFAENTCILHCRVERVSNFCENASRFTRIIGNYIRDGYPLTICRIRNPKNGAGLGQAIIADNIIEGGNLGGAMGIIGGQVIISNNIFTSYSKETAVSITGEGKVIFSGNVVDLTHEDDNMQRPRAGVMIEAPQVIVADNHIIDRGQSPDPDVIGIGISGKARNLQVHDNIIENCGTPIARIERPVDTLVQCWRFDKADVWENGPGLRIHDNTFVGCASSGTLSSKDFPAAGNNHSVPKDPA